jgi:hypothetical protein
MKKAIALFGALGVLGVFLPIAAGLSLFDFRHFDAVPVYLMLAAFAAPLCAALAEKTFVAAVTGTLGFGYALYKFGFDILDVLLHASIGGKLMAVAAIAGFACSLLGFAETNNKRE